MRFMTLVNGREFNITDLMTVGTQLILGVRDVNGLATLASASLSEMPAWAALRAEQSLAPSPHIPTP